MRRFRRLALAALLLGSSVVPAWAESLADTMVAAYRTSSLLDQNRALLRAADEDVATAVARMRPIISWALQSQYAKGPLAEQLTATLGLQAQLTLFDFGRRQLGIDIAKESVLSLREALVNIEQQVLLNAVQAYLQVRAAREQVDLQSNSVRLIEQERQAARDRFDVGEITQTDVSLAEARLAAGRAGLASAQGQLEIAEEQFKSAAGREPGRLEAPPPKPERPASLEAAQTAAQRTHPAILQSRREAAVAELAVAASKAERRPTVGITAQTGLNRDQDINSAIGLSMNQTIYSGGALSSAMRRSMAQRDAARASLLNAGKEVALQVGTAWANIDVASAQINAIERQIGAAREAYDGVREEATLGARTTLDVLDAEQSLLTAQADLITAQANQQLAHYQLLASMGLLTVEHLKLGIPTYDPSAYYGAVRDAPYTSSQGENLDRVLRAIGKTK